MKKIIEGAEELMKAVKNKTLWKNAITYTLENINTVLEIFSSGIKPGRMERSPEIYSIHAFRGYHSIHSCPQYLEMRKKFSKEIEEIEEKFKNELLWKELIENIKHCVVEGKSPIFHVVSQAFEEYHNLIFHPQYPEMKKKFSDEIEFIERQFKDRDLRKNMIESIFSSIEGRKYLLALEEYHYLLFHPQYPEIMLEFSNEIKQIEERIMKEKIVDSTFLEMTVINGYFLEQIKQGQKKGRKDEAVAVLAGYHHLLSFLYDLYKRAQKKMAQMEHQKAIHPKRKLPPIPEEKAF